ncbi:alpha/beta hydrolase family protein [Phenylobacterium sp.]|jgi:dienelactone hydrolase|uniref:alpha/beta hydrolase family protein n=1 Tax=Phenylobacterium sp. TaxID=1871053 RepID=UPI002F9534A5
MLKRLISSAAAVALAACASLAMTTPAAAAPPAAEVFANRPAVTSLQLSPDGKHIAGIVSPDGKQTFVAVWQTSNPNQPPKLTPSGKGQELWFLDFVKNDRLIVGVQQLVDYSFQGSRTRTHFIRPLLMSLDGSDVKPLLPRTNSRSEQVEFAEALSPPGLVDTLPNDPRYILVQDSGPSGRDIYKVDVYTGTASRQALGSGKFGEEQVDLQGEVRARQELSYQDGRAYIAQWIRNPANNRWEEHFRWFAKDREPMSIVGFTPDPNIAYLATNRGRDKTAIYEYSIKDRKILEPVFEHKLFDAEDVILSQAAGDRGRVLGFAYNAETTKTFWVDEKLAAADRAIRQGLGVKTRPVQWTDPGAGQTATFNVADGFDTRIIGWSDDLSKILAIKEGPRQPPEYYLLADGKLTLLGKSRQDVDPGSLGDTTLVQYKARDGLVIPAFLTTPPASAGQGPHPAIIVPHGGPWSRDEMGWDVTGWTQYFASRGYVVLQPQFRGSLGWGQKIWRAGDAEWGQKMQDDLDDGAKWLIEQRLAAPNRIAVHGYSYGGYAAYAAAVRPNGLYQCTIAGAGVAEPANFQRSTYDNPLLREFQSPTIKGLSAMKEVSKIEIPLFIYHGDRDQIVPYKETVDMVGKLKGAGRNYKLVELPDMGHTYNTWSPDNAKVVLTTVENWLKNDCGPGGL